MQLDYSRVDLAELSHCTLCLTSWGLVCGTGPGGDGLQLVGV